MSAAPDPSQHMHVLLRPHTAGQAHLNGVASAELRERHDAWDAAAGRVSDSGGGRREAAAPFGVVLQNIQRLHPRQFQVNERAVRCTARCAS